MKKFKYIVRHTISSLHYGHLNHNSIEQGQRVINRLVADNFIDAIIENMDIGVEKVIQNGTIPDDIVYEASVYILSEAQLQKLVNEEIEKRYNNARKMPSWGMSPWYHRTSILHKPFSFINEAPV